jgi:polysaccharide export outer membrane protein
MPGETGKEGTSMKRTHTIRSLRSFCVEYSSLWGLFLAALVTTGCAATSSHQGATALRQEPSFASADAGPAVDPSITPLDPTLTALNNTIAATALQSPAAASDYQLGPEDLLEITLFNVPENETGVTPRRMEVRVSQQGKITLPLLGDIPTEGKTPSELERDLTGRYAKYLRSPEVGVAVREYRSQRVSVIGAVRNPGVFELTGPKTMIDLLAMAGGVTEKAGRQVHIYRQGPNGRESHVMDLYTLIRSPGTNPADATNDVTKLMVQAGDVMNVPETGMFFIDGAVKKPGSFPLNRPYTLSQALSVAGGVDVELAKTSQVSIIRRQGGSEVATFAVNLDAIKEGNAVDPTIEAEDVIFVPMSGAKYFVKRFVGNIISGFSLNPLLY